MENHVGRLHLLMPLYTTISVLLVGLMLLASYASSHTTSLIARWTTAEIAGWVPKDGSTELWLLLVLSQPSSVTPQADNAAGLRYLPGDGQA
jgi:hypothetical protein